MNLPSADNTREVFLYGGEPLVQQLPLAFLTILFVLFTEWASLISVFILAVCSWLTFTSRISTVQARHTNLR